MRMRCKDEIIAKRDALHRASLDRMAKSRTRNTADAIDQIFVMEQTLNWVLNPGKLSALDWIIDRVVIDQPKSTDG